MLNFFPAYYNVPNGNFSPGPYRLEAPRSCQPTPPSLEAPRSRPPSSQLAALPCFEARSPTGRSPTSARSPIVNAEMIAFGTMGDRVGIPTRSPIVPKAIISAPSNAPMGITTIHVAADAKIEYCAPSRQGVIPPREAANPKNGPSVAAVEKRPRVISGAALIGEARKARASSPVSGAAGVDHVATIKGNAHDRSQVNKLLLQCDTNSVGSASAENATTHIFATGGETGTARGRPREIKSMLPDVDWGKALRDWSLQSSRRMVPQKTLNSPRGAASVTNLGRGAAGKRNLLEPPGGAGRLLSTIDWDRGYSPGPPV